MGDGIPQTERFICKPPRTQHDGGATHGQGQGNRRDAKDAEKLKFALSASFASPRFQSPCPFLACPRSTDVADGHALLERGDDIGTLGDELLRDVAFEAGLDDGLHHGRIMNLLGVVDLVAAGHAAGVVMSEVLVMFLNGGDEVALHDLHVIDVVEQLESLRADTLAQLDAPRGLIALVVGVIDAAVEEFHDRQHVVLFADGHHALEADRAILKALLVGLALPVAGETDDVFEAGLGDLRRSLLVEGDKLVMVFQPVESAGDAAGHAADHCAEEAVFLERRKVLHFQQFDGLQAHFLPGDAEVLERNLRVTPFADGMVDVALERGASRGLGGAKARME